MSVNMSVDPEIQKRIAEGIALLHYLGDFPCVSLPTPHQPQTASEGYALSLDHELELTSDLAFLSSIRSDKSNITAVAIHQTDQDGLRVLLAANATFRGSDQAYLEQVRSGLADITQAMEKAASSNRRVSASNLLAAIVRTCGERILERTCTAHGNALRTHVAEAIAVMKHPQSRRVRQSLLEKMQCLEHVLTRLDTVFADPKQHAQGLHSAMTALITCCDEVLNCPGMDEFLEKDLHRLRPKSGTPFEQSKASTIRDKIRKLARYQTCATRLNHLARAHRILRNMSVHCISLPEDGLRWIDISEAQSSIEEVVSRVGTTGGLTKRQLTGLMSKRASCKAVRNRSFEDSLKRAQGGEAKIHAEVQLMWYLGQQQIGHPPRVIESHKKPCFLCAVLMICSGKYPVQRTHGQIHHGWRLPSTVWDGMHERFAQDLDMYAAYCVRAVLGSEHIPKVQTMRCHSSATLYRAGIMSVLTVLSRADGDDEGVTPDSSEVTLRRGGTAIARTAAEGGASTDLEADQIPVPAGIEESAGHDCLLSPGPLGKKRSYSAVWMSIPPGGTAWVRLDTKLQVLIEHESLQGSKAGDLKVHVRQLSIEEAGQRRSRECVHDVVEDLKAGNEIKCGRGGGPVLMRLGSEVYAVEVDAAA